MRSRACCRAGSRASRSTSRAPLRAAARRRTRRSVTDPTRQRHEPSVACDRSAAMGYHVVRGGEHAFEERPEARGPRERPGRARVGPDDGSRASAVARAALALPARHARPPPRGQGPGRGLRRPRRDADDAPRRAAGTGRAAARRASSQSSREPRSSSATTATTRSVVFIYGAPAGAGRRRLLRRRRALALRTTSSWVRRGASTPFARKLSLLTQPARSPRNPLVDEPASVERLRDEIEELRASRARIAATADGERRRIERALHDGVQQDLIALAVNLQLARGSPTRTMRARTSRRPAATSMTPSTACERSARASTPRC